MNSQVKLSVALVALTAASTVGVPALAQDQFEQSYYESDDSGLYDSYDGAQTSYQCGCADYGSGYGTGDYGCADGGYGCGGYGDCGYGDCGYGTGCGGGLGGAWGIGGGMQCFAGAEYLYIRASFSEAVAYAVQEVGLPNNHNQYDIFEQDFDYNSSYRFYGGIRDAACGMELRFDYTRFRSQADAVSAVAGMNGNVTTFFPFIEPSGPNGQTVIATGEVELDSYDLSCGKTIPLGSPLGGGCGCADPCGCGDGCGGWCPAWDITWEAGVRAADVHWGQSFVGTAIDPMMDDTSSTRLSTMDFEGVGLRFGLGGRRYFGRQGLFSVYCNGDISLLLGDVELALVGTDEDASGSVPVISSIAQTASFRNVIPVTEIEVGATGHLTSNWSVSAGYLISAWHDLGMRPEFDPFTAELNFNGYDDANILGFDGFFARLEGAF